MECVWIGRVWIGRAVCLMRRRWTEAQGTFPRVTNDVVSLRHQHLKAAIYLSGVAIRHVIFLTSPPDSL
jgi:hypothetical protein